MTMPIRKMGSVSKLTLYQTWMNMRQRCNNKNRPDYPYYGGRGIVICDEWMSFEKFYSWAQATGYRDGLTLDRISTNGNYDPSNCRWATRLEQANNMRKNVFLEYDGKLLTISQWAREVSMTDHAIRWRLKQGWSTEKVLTTKTRARRKPNTVRSI